MLYSEGFKHFWEFNKRRISSNFEKTSEWEHFQERVEKVRRKENDLDIVTIQEADAMDGRQWRIIKEISPPLIQENCMLELIQNFWDRNTKPKTFKR